jgi:hypothetical protein
MQVEGFAMSVMHLNSLVSRALKKRACGYYWEIKYIV